MKWKLLKCQIIAHVEIEGEYKHIYAAIPLEELDKYIEAGLADIIGEEIINKEEDIKEIKDKEEPRHKIKFSDMVIHTDKEREYNNYLKTIYDIKNTKKYPYNLDDIYFEDPAKSKKWR